MMKLLFGLLFSCSSTSDTGVSVRKEWMDISASRSSACAVSTEGEIFCWPGSEQKGLRDKQYKSVWLPEHYYDSEEYWSACAIDADDQVFCWGENTHGQTESPDTKFSKLSIGEAFVCGITLESKVECWGRGFGESWALPVHGVFTEIVSDLYNTCALSEDGKIYCWDSQDVLEVRLFAAEHIDLFEYLCGSTSGMGLSCTSVGGSEVIEFEYDYEPPDDLGNFCMAYLDSGCTLTSAGKIECWGPSSHYYPWEGSLDIIFQKISCGFGVVCGLSNMHEVYCWSDYDWFVGEVGIVP